MDAADEEIQQFIDGLDQKRQAALQSLQDDTWQDRPLENNGFEDSFAIQDVQDEEPSDAAVQSYLLEATATLEPSAPAEMPVPVMADAMHRGRSSTQPISTTTRPALNKKAQSQPHVRIIIQGRLT